MVTLPLTVYSIYAIGTDREGFFKLMALMLVILSSTSILLFAIGIVGSYAWRGFENSKNQPNMIIKESNEHS